MRFRQHDAAEPGVLHETIQSLVAPHHDVRDHIDPQPRCVALADATIEQIDAIRNFLEQRIECLVENLETRDFGVAQIDHDAGTIRSLDPRLTQRIAQPYGLVAGRRLGPDTLRVRHLRIRHDNLGRERIRSINLAETLHRKKALVCQ